MEAALCDSGLSPDDVDVVFGEGCGTVAGDRAEASALRRVFGARRPPVTVTKAAYGHLYGGAFGTELACALPPSRDFPAYAQTHPLPQPRDGESWALAVGGLVQKPARLTLQMLHALPRLTYTVKHHCVEGWTAIATWTGVPLSAVIALVEPTPAARYLRLDSFDNGYYNGWDLKSALHPQTILAYAWNDLPLTPAHGAPLRLYSPVKLGYKLTKYLSALTFTADRPGGLWEDQGYPWLGGI